ncbi:MAG: DPP IV N-terminal domain-containing protein [Calditrichota bacterium]
MMKKTLNLIVIFTLFAILLTNCTRYDNPELKKQPFKVAYNVMVDESSGNYEVFIMNLDGSEKQNITNSPAVDWVYYSYNNRIYFISDRDTTPKLFFLYQMDADGNNIKQITKFPVENSWITGRNEGEELIVSSSKDSARYELYLIDKEGNELKRLTNNKYYDNDPCFSPDGKQIVFRSRRPWVDELWIMDDNGENARQLTHYPVKDSTAGDFHYHAGPPFWEPNRNVITFMSYQNFNYDIYEMNPDGSDLKPLLSGPFDEGWHSWSSDGRYLAYDGTNIKGNYDIYLLEYKSQKIHRLTHDEQFEQAPILVDIIKEEDQNKENL